MKNNIILPYVFKTDGNKKVFLNRKYEVIEFSSNVKIESYIKTIHTQHRKQEYDGLIMDCYWLYNDETTKHEKQDILNELKKIIMTDSISPCPPNPQDQRADAPEKP